MADDAHGADAGLPATDSTVIDAGTSPTAPGAGTPDLREPTSIEDVLAAEAARLRDEDAKTVEPDDGDHEDDAKADAKAKGEKAAEDAKAKLDDAKAKARSPDGKFSKKEGDGDNIDADSDEPKQAPRAEETPRKYAEPPAKFLPEARVKWANVPNEIKAEFHRVEQEREAEVQRYRADAEEYETLREYRDMAKRSGTDLKRALDSYVGMENELRRDPIAGLEKVVQGLGIRKQDGTPVTLYDVATRIVQQGPEAFQRSVQPPQYQPHSSPQPQSDPRVEALEQEIRALRAETSVLPVIRQFEAQHPDFEQIAPQVQAILDSGVIDRLYGNGLSIEQKLGEAYRMAGGKAPSSVDTRAADAPHSEVEARPVNPDAGRKSIRGAPANGVDTSADDKSTDLRDILRKEIRKIA